MVLKGLSPNDDDYKTTTFTSNSFITQQVGTGQTAVGRVVSYDKTTGVLRYWQDRSLVGFNTDGTQQATPTYGFELNQFSGEPITGGNLKIVGGTKDLYIDSGFGSASSPGTVSYTHLTLPTKRIV